MTHGIACKVVLLIGKSPGAACINLKPWETAKYAQPHLRYVRMVNQNSIIRPARTLPNFALPAGLPPSLRLLPTAASSQMMKIRQNEQS
jgi:hypothetical protein